MPCGRCRSHGITCTYGRLGLAEPLTSPRLADSSHSSSSVVSNTEVSSGRKQGQVSVRFLLALTRPSSYDASAAVAADAPELDTVEIKTGRFSPRLHSADEYAESDMILLDLDPCSLEYFDYCPPVMAEEAAFDQHHPETPSLEARMREIVHILSAVPTSKWGCLRGAHNRLSVELAHTVFTVAHLRHFVSGYFHHYYDHLPIIHKPTFDIHTISLRLLLAMFLLGSLSFAPSDASCSTQRFFDVAEAYIFEHPIFDQVISDPDQGNASDDAIETLQAALMLLIVQLSNCDRVVRRRILLQKLPCFISAVRTLGLFGYKHRSIASNTHESKWQHFIHEEVRMRLAAHTFMTDSYTAVFFNRPPQVDVSEMLGDRPYREDIFEVKTALDFERLAFPEISEPQSYSLSGLSSFLFSGSVPDTLHLVEKHITAADLLMMVCAIQSVAMVSKANYLMPEAATMVVRASDRWKILWDRVKKEEESRCISQRGFVKHAAEFWWLVKMVAEVAQSGEPVCRYLEPLPSDSMEDLHDFIKKYKTRPGTSEDVHSH
ncbi:hypothetical protein BS50DRAFT_578170 [Corynespora cassiicola Philippines]|uniref:Xylanolytic transcriptional activator regulatory domain-containing protein n=1 Tax=Corynespora cassiicola Philippines TaxID=1448308 RepID=A0A2T2N870_CORCC|nr:hypothetical protein BS50DRAFT_578170 [Corynespora cassiicola Philippines]